LDRLLVSLVGDVVRRGGFAEQGMTPVQGLEAVFGGDIAHARQVARPDRRRTTRIHPSRMGQTEKMISRSS
jgi:hypothetical protein